MAKARMVQDAIAKLDTKRDTKLDRGYTSHARQAAHKPRQRTPKVGTCFLCHDDRVPRYKLVEVEPGLFAHRHHAGVSPSDD